jgi:predicted transposase YbfD/YdcC
MINLKKLVKDGKLPCLYYELKTQIPEYRKAGHLIKYNLAELTVLVILATMSGYNTQRQIADFAVNNPKINIKPEKSTINRFCINVDIKAINQVLRGWLRKLIKLLGISSFAIDGKVLRGQNGNTGDEKENMLYVITAFSHELGIALNWENFDGGKSSEIHSFRNMLNDELIELITGDALHCNQETLKLVNSLNKKYLIACKQQKLLKNLINKGKIVEEKQTENREVTVFEIPDGFYVQNKHSKSWQNCQIKTLICIEFTRNNIPEMNYYITNYMQDAELFNIEIKQHWNIENGLHWNKDVVFHEDKHRTIYKNSALVFSAIFTFVISIFKIQNPQTVGKQIQKYCNKIRKCISILGLSKQSKKILLT